MQYPVALYVYSINRISNYITMNYNIIVWLPAGLLVDKFKMFVIIKELEIFEFEPDLIFLVLRNTNVLKSLSRVALNLKS